MKKTKEPTINFSIIFNTKKTLQFNIGVPNFNTIKMLNKST